MWKSDLTLENCPPTSTCTPMHVCPCTTYTHHKEQATARRIKLTSPLTPQSQPTNALGCLSWRGPNRKPATVCLPWRCTPKRRLTPTHMCLERCTVSQSRGQEPPGRACYSHLRTISSSQTTSVTISSHKHTHKSCHCDSTKHGFLF